MSDFEGLGKVVADELMKRFDEADVILTGTTRGKIRRWIEEILSPYCCFQTTKDG